MLTFEQAKQIAVEERKRDGADGLNHVSVYESDDRWAFVFTNGAMMYPPPALFVFKTDGRVEWFSIPPIENLRFMDDEKRKEYSF